MRFLELMRVVGGRGVEVVEMRAGSDPEILGVCEDSRKVRAGDLFIAEWDEEERGRFCGGGNWERGSGGGGGEWSVVGGQWSD